MKLDELVDEPDVGHAENQAGAGDRGQCPPHAFSPTPPAGQRRQPDPRERPERDPAQSGDDPEEVRALGRDGRNTNEGNLASSNAEKTHRDDHPLHLQPMVLHVADAIGVQALDAGYSSCGARPRPAARSSGRSRAGTTKPQREHHAVVARPGPSPLGRHHDTDHRPVRRHRSRSGASGGGTTVRETARASGDRWAEALQSGAPRAEASWMRAGQGGDTMRRLIKLTVVVLGASGLAYAIRARRTAS